MDFTPSGQIKGQSRPPGLKLRMTENFETRESSTPGNLKFGKRIAAGQDVFMTVKFRSVKAPCRRLTGDAKLLESQLLHDAAAGVVPVEVPDADRLRAQAPERVTN